MAAKFFVYRNLHRGLAFSVRFRGRVVDRLENFIATDVEFRVSEAGRQTVLTRKRKEVHAFVVCSAYHPTQMEPSGLTGVRYNPYTMSTFQVDGKSIYQADAVLFAGGRCYLLNNEESNPTLSTESQGP